MTDSKRVPVEVGQIRQNPDRRYVEMRGELRWVCVVAALPGARQAVICDLASGRHASIKVATLEKWPLRPAVDATETTP